ncbi:DUF421 domain-containing protein [Chitinimonas sp. BJB300]|uniref:DUF421 domain-containing protein n=1 Tax=Chitinimonas sp. BJB300 TaxID=1559339 RepID=UPI0013047BDF|nr:YetF domain-containing protein [Chitinimonas sp. BJB300]
MFAVNMNPLELIIRGTALYWFLIFIFRVVLPRNVGEVTIADVLLLVLIANASQNTMVGGYTTVTEGFILVITLVGWSALFEWLTFHFPAIQKILEPFPLVLVRSGRVNYRNLRKEFLSVEDLKAKLRERGIEYFIQVKIAYLKSDGQFGVIEIKDKGAKSGNAAENKVI